MFLKYIIIFVFWPGVYDSKVVAFSASLQGIPSGEGSLRKLCPPMDNVPQPPNRVNTTLRLHKLRSEMKKMNVIQMAPIDAYIITTDDDHQTEYVAERDQRLRYISGFSGSYGFAVVTADKAALWTDGRYHLQADNELDCNWYLMGRGEVASTMTEWLSNTLKQRSRVGADPSLVSSANWERWAKQLSLAGVFLLPVRNNLIDIIWTEGRANYSRHKAYVWDNEYAGRTWMSKVLSVRQQMKEMDCDAMVVTALDEIAWVLNIRGRDLPYNPLLRAYLVITKDQLHLYVGKEKLSPEVKRHLSVESCYNPPYCVKVHDYDAVWDDLKSLSQIWKQVLLPAEDDFSGGVSRAIYTAIPVDKRKVAVSPIMIMKAQKNVVERDGMRKAHLRDAVAFCDFFAYLEDQIKKGQVWDEMKIADTLDQFRREQFQNRGISFPTVVAFGPHSAIPHYEPKNTTSIQVDKSSVLLVDSGGHYLDGTTDVTRTFHFGTPTKREKDIYTRLLMASIDVASLSFPQYLPMRDIDLIIRAPLWSTGLDYNHGSGHGVGSFNLVHESPVNVNWGSTDMKTFREGHFFTAEPGYYQEGSFGIRLENVLEVIQDFVNESHGLFLGFRVVTLIPFEPKLIDIPRLSPHQRRWLNNYNTRVRNEVGAELKKQLRMKGFYWMMDRTKHIPEDCGNTATFRVISDIKVILLVTLLPTVTRLLQRPS